MTTSLIDADSLLAVDIGTIHTRATLFDVVEGRYRFLATGTAPTTVGFPFRDAGEGVRLAIDQLQEIAGRTLIGVDEHLILPSQSDGSGVDTMVATISAGEALKTVIVGLLDDISVESARNLAATTYAQVLETLSLSDRRRTAVRLDALLRLRPDLVVIAGGTDGGASHSVLGLIEAVGLACYLLPKDQKPEILFVGNHELEREIRASLESYASLHIAPNIRPALEFEQLDPAQSELGKVYRMSRARHTRGVQELDQLTGGRMSSTAGAFGRTVRIISSQNTKSKKGTLGVDVGASSITVAMALNSQLSMDVSADLGLGKNVTNILTASSIDEVARWLPFEIEPADLHNYVLQKSIYPGSLPATPEELALEQALACQMLYIAVRKALRRLPPGLAQPISGLLPPFEPIIATGSVFLKAPTFGQSMFMLLNALQPTGVTTIALDQNNLVAAIGAAAEINSLLALQALDSSNFLNLGTVISPVGKAPAGSPVLRIKAKFDDDHETSLDIKFGSIETIPLPIGQSATLSLQPLNRFDVGMGGPGGSGSLKVKGGIHGVVIDARGRPLQLPEEPARRIELVKKWLWTLGS